MGVRLNFWVRLLLNFSININLARFEYVNFLNFLALLKNWILICKLLVLKAHDDHNYALKIEIGKYFFSEKNASFDISNSCWI